LSNLKKIELSPRGLNTLFGVQDQNIKYLESLLGISIGARGNELTIEGEPQNIETVENILRDFTELFDEGGTFSDKELRDAFKQIAEDRAYSLKIISPKRVLILRVKKPSRRKPPTSANISKRFKTKI
jgi:phosphate starvation-inducible PhoH-like protein